MRICEKHSPHVQEAYYILPCKLETITGGKAESAVTMLDRLKGLLQKLPYENYITLAKLLYHLNRLVCSYWGRCVHCSSIHSNCFLYMHIHLRFI